MVAAGAPPALLTTAPPTSTHASSTPTSSPGRARTEPSEVQRAAWLADAAPLVARMCANRGWGQDAADLAQEVLVATWRAQHNPEKGLDDAEGVRRYAASIAKVATPRSFLSKRSVAAELLGQVVDESAAGMGETGVPERLFADYGFDPEQAARDHARVDAAAARLDELSTALTPRQRQVVGALRDGASSMDELAAELGIGAGGANTTKRAALERMRVAAGVSQASDPAQMPRGPGSQRAEEAARVFAAQHGRLPVGHELATASGVGVTVANKVLRALHLQQGSSPREGMPHAKAERAGEEFLATHGRLPAQTELAAAAGVSIETSRHALTRLRAAHPDAPAGAPAMPNPATNQARVVALNIARTQGALPTIRELRQAAGVSAYAANSALQALRLQPLPTSDATATDRAPNRAAAGMSASNRAAPASTSTAAGTGDGDGDARGQWLRDAEPLVRAMCAARLPSGQVDDAVQAVMEATWRAQHAEGKTLDDPDSVRRYAATVAKVIQPARTRVSVPTTPSDRLTDHPATATEIGDGSGGAGERVAGLLGVLPEREREIMLASRFGDRDTDEVAAELGLTPSGVRSAQTRAMARLREAAGTTSPNPLASGRRENDRSREHRAAHEQAGRLPDGPATARVAAEARRFHGEHGRFPSRAELVARSETSAGTAQKVIRALRTQDSTDHDQQHDQHADQQPDDRAEERTGDRVEELARAHRDQHGRWPSAAVLRESAGVGIGEAGTVLRALREHDDDPPSDRRTERSGPDTGDVQARVAVAQAAVAAHQADTTEQHDTDAAADEAARAEQLTRWHTHDQTAQQVADEADASGDDGALVDERNTANSENRERSCE